MLTDYALKLLLTITLAACGLVLKDLRGGQADLSVGLKDVRDSQTQNQLATVEKLARIETQISNAAKDAESTNREIRELKDRMTVLERSRGR
ncbi:MAG: hypothetical protein NTZ11_18460 [Gammaproteobacteria bacterium]|nr:hypothetical protein [Gammaproteobacteria bacterium]